MSPLHKSLLLFLGAGIGANLRYWLGAALQATTPSAFPWATLLINVSGSVALGALVGFSLKLNLHPGWMLFLGIGLLGGYTTFSTFAIEAVSLLEEDKLSLLLIYVVASTVFSILGAWIGISLTK